MEFTASRQGEMNTGSLFTFSFLFSISPRMVPLALRAGFPPKNAFTEALRDNVIQMILSPGKLTGLTITSSLLLLKQGAVVSTRIICGQIHVKFEGSNGR